MQMFFNSLSVYSFTEQTRKPIEHGATLSASCFFINLIIDTQYAGVVIHSGASKGQARSVGGSSGVGL